MMKQKGQQQETQLKLRFSSENVPPKKMAIISLLFAGARLIPNIAKAPIIRCHHVHCLAI